MEETTNRITTPSTRTISERKKLQNLLDNFTTFSWDGLDMFDNFGAFIINEKKGSLKMYNGASFKNEYSKPQFQNGYTNLAGVTFDTQTINFTIGVYWISMEDYRKLINHLHPYKIARLQFGFDKIYGYNCKLQSIKDSTRYVVGREINTTDSTSGLMFSHLEGSDQEGYRYYTELQLTFDVIGPQCAVAQEHIIFNWEEAIEQGESTHFYYPVFENKNDYISDLEMPFKIQLSYFNQTIDLSNEQETIPTPSPIKIIIQCKSKYPATGEVEVENTMTVCTVVLKNIESHSSISLKYDSAQGLIYWQTGNKEQILSLLSVSDTGMRIVDSLDVKQFYWPGLLDHPELNNIKLQTLVQITNLSATDEESRYITNQWEKVYTVQRRTNVL